MNRAPQGPLPDRWALNLPDYLVDDEETAAHAPATTATAIAKLEPRQRETLEEYREDCGERTIIYDTGRKTSEQVDCESLPAGESIKRLV